MTDVEQTRWFLEQQLQWCKEQDRILETIQHKLQEIKHIAKYARDHELSAFEIDRLNQQLEQLQTEIDLLKSELQGEVH